MPMIFFDLLTTLETEQHEFLPTLLQKKLALLFANHQSSQENPVQLMTIHKAKGLEFDHVILPALNKRTANNDSELFLSLIRRNQKGDNDLLIAPIRSAAVDEDPIYRLLNTIEKQKLRQESARLFYVACTRAKNSIDLLCCLTMSEDGEIQSPNRGSFLDMLWPTLETEFIKNATQCSSSSTEAFEDDVNLSTLTRLTSQWQSPMSDTAFDFVENKNDPALRALNQPLPTKIDWPQQELQIIGTAIHEALEQLARHHDNTPPSSRHWQRRLCELGLNAPAIPRALALIEQAINNTLADPRGRWIFNKAHRDDHSEYALAYQQHNKIKHYILDRTFIDEEGTRWIIDFKTATPDNEQSLDDFLAIQRQRHEPQLQHYAAYMHQLYPEQNIRLGLYFPLCNAWLEFAAIVKTELIT